MFLIDKPYVSDFLIKTLKENNYKIVATKEAHELIPDNKLNWISEEEAIKYIETHPDEPIYLSSENSLSWVIGKLSLTKLLGQIMQFKDKFRFRELVKSFFPDYSFRSVKLDDIPELDISDIGLPFVIKPTLGFFSLGVHIIHNETDWEVARQELNYNKLQNIYPAEVLNTSTFIIEDYIEGEEYAIDCYFNNQGELVILNILHHRFSTGKDISHRVYSTSGEIILRHLTAIEEFLNSIGNKLGLTNFPAHVELRVDINGKIIPVEVNPLRFGGWCTTSDLSWYAYGINSYEYFIGGLKPDWENILENNNDKIYSLIVLNNNSGIAPEDIVGFDYDLLEEDFENVLITRKLDLDKYSIFGFIFTESSKGKKEELDNILQSDLRKYILTR